MKIYLHIFICLCVFLKSNAQDLSTKKIDSLLEIAYTSRSENTSLAIQLSEKAYSYSEKAGYARGKIKSLDNLSFCCYINGKSEKSFSYAVMMEKEAMSIKDHTYRCYALRMKGVNYSVLGFYDEADQMIDDGLRISDEIQEPNDRHKIKGILYSAKAIVISDRNANWKNKSQKQLSYHKKAVNEYLQITKKDKVYWGNLASEYNNIADQYIDIKQFDSAQYFLKASLNISIKAKNSYNEYTTLYTLGKLNYNFKNYDKAAAYMEEMVYKTLLHKDPYSRRIGYESLIIVYRDMKNKKMEQEFLSKYTQLNDSLNFVEKRAIKAPLEQIAKENEAKFNYQKYRLYYIISGIVLLLVIVFYFGYKYYKNFQKEKAAKQEKEEIIIEKDTKLSEMKLQVDDSFDKVIELAKKDDPLFVTLFKELYPIFYQELMKKQSDLTLSELKICFYIRLKFSTKEIAEYTFVTPKAIQNRKNRLRKRLEIPQEEDIYIWMENLDKI